MGDPALTVVYTLLVELNVSKSTGPDQITIHIHKDVTVPNAD